jgi:hypothetical protein
MGRQFYNTRYEYNIPIAIVTLLIILSRNENFLCGRNSHKPAPGMRAEMVIPHRPPYSIFDYFFSILEHLVRVFQLQHGMKIITGREFTLFLNSISLTEEMSLIEHRLLSCTVPCASGRCSNEFPSKAGLLSRVVKMIITDKLKHECGGRVIENLTALFEFAERRVEILGFGMESL